MRAAKNRGQMQKIAKSDRRIGTDRQTDKVRYREAPPIKRGSEKKKEE